MVVWSQCCLSRVTEGGNRGGAQDGIVNRVNTVSQPSISPGEQWAGRRVVAW